MNGSRTNLRRMIAVGLLTVPTWCFGATRNIDNQNASCSDGTGTPYCTINAAVSAADAGDVLQVAAGTYNENVSLTKSLTLTGAGATVTIVDGGNTDRALTIWNDATVSGFTFQHGNGGTSGLGGAVAQINDHEVVLTDCVLRDSTASHGAGMFVDGTVTIARTLIIGNTAVADPSSWSFGGGVYASGTLTITDSTISANTADDAGGIFNMGTLTMTNTTLSGNAAGMSDGAGALQNGSGSEGMATLRNVTITGNSSSSSFGGIFNMNGIVDIGNSIVAGNTAAVGGPDCGGQAITSAGYNFVGTTSGCTLTAGTGDLLNQGAAAAKLSTLGDYGGPTPTHTLLSGSPAIDGGSNTLCPAADQRGMARPIDGDGDSTATCDIGALELRDGIAAHADAASTTEAGGTAVVTVVLLSAPLSDVSITVSSSDLTEGTVAPASLTFTAANWNTPQTVTVTGVDDAEVDGDVEYQIEFAITTADPTYGAVTVAPVQMTNTDNDTGGGGDGGGDTGGDGDGGGDGDADGDGSGGGGGTDLFLLALLALGTGVRLRAPRG